MLQAQLLDKQQEGMREEQEEQQRLVSIREMQVDMHVTSSYTYVTSS